MSFVLFDFAGTVAQYEPSTMDIAYDFLQRLGYIEDRAQLGDLVYRTNCLFGDKRCSKHYQSEPAFWRAAASLLTGNLNQETCKMSEELLDNLRTIRESGEIAIKIDFNSLEQIASTGIGMAILSNWQRTLPDYCRELGVDHYFRFILASEAIGVSKPSLAAFQLAVEKTKRPPSEVLYVGDNYYIDFLSAKRAGLFSVLFDPKGWYDGFDCNKVGALQDILGHLNVEVEAKSNK